jgi:hypothetical protein
MEAPPPPPPCLTSRPQKLYCWQGGERRTRSGGLSSSPLPCQGGSGGIAPVPCVGQLIKQQASKQAQPVSTTTTKCAAWTPCARCTKRAEPASIARAGFVFLGSTLRCLAGSETKGMARPKTHPCEKLTPFLLLAAYDTAGQTRSTEQQGRTGPRRDTHGAHMRRNATY